MRHPDRYECAWLKKITLETLEALREIFPLQQRIEAAAPVQAAYVSMVNHWRVHAAPPDKECIEPALMDVLVEMDAVVPQPNGLGCYPFSADPTDFVVRCADGSRVHAFCAIDALAIPRLLSRAARIESRCASCGQLLRCDVTEDGALAEQPLDRTVVVWEPDERTMAGDACCRTLCRRIRFMCSACAGWTRGRIFTLPQAAVIANAFFSFQRRLIDERSMAHHE